MSRCKPLERFEAVVQFNGRVQRCYISRGQNNILIRRDGRRFQQTNKAERVWQHVDVFVDRVNQLTMKKVRDLASRLSNIAADRARSYTLCVCLFV